MNLTIVIPFNSETHAEAERLLDCIYWLDEKQCYGSCFLVAEHGTHEEWKLKTRIAAEVACEFVSMIQLKKDENPLLGAAKFIHKSHRFPWIYLEPDCVPLVKGWRQTLIAAYNKQPRRYMGPHLKTNTGAMLLPKTAIYCPDAEKDMNQPLFELSTKTRLIQELVFDGDESKIRPDAVLLHGDKMGTLVERIIDRSFKECGSILRSIPLAKIDRRTRAYRQSLVKV